MSCEPIGTSRSKPANSGMKLACDEAEAEAEEEEEEVQESPTPIKLIRFIATVKGPIANLNTAMLVAIFCALQSFKDVSNLSAVCRALRATKRITSLALGNSTAQSL